MTDETVTTPTEAPTPSIETTEPSNGVAPNPLDLFNRFSGGENEAAPAQEDKPTPDPDPTPEATTTAPAQDKKAQKAIRLQTETGDMEVPEQAKLRVKVDNEEIEFTLKDAANSYKTSKRIEKEFSKLNDERQGVKREKEEIAKAQKDLAYIDYNLRLVQKYAQEGNIPAAAQVILAMGAGGDSTAMKALIKKSEEFALSLADMSDAEKEVLFGKHEVELERDKLARERAELTSTASRTELKVYVDKIKDHYKITDQDLGQALDTLQKRGATIPEDPKEITNVCANWVLAGRRVDTVIGAIKRIDPAKATDSNLIEAIAELCEPEWGEDDIADVVKGYLGSTNGSAKATAEEVKKEEPISAPTQKSPAPAKVASAEKESGGGPILSYEDIIAKYQ